jgi:hypothetical protein
VPLKAFQWNNRVALIYLRRSGYQSTVCRGTCLCRCWSPEVEMHRNAGYEEEWNWKQFPSRYRKPGCIWYLPEVRGSCLTAQLQYCGAPDSVPPLTPIAFAPTEIHSRQTFPLRQHPTFGFERPSIRSSGSASEATLNRVGLSFARHTDF